MCDIQILVEELAELEHINKALKRQVLLNENRIAEIDKILAKNCYKDEPKGDNNECIHSRNLL